MNTAVHTNYKVRQVASGHYSSTRTSPLHNQQSHSQCTFTMQRHAINIGTTEPACERTRCCHLRRNFYGFVYPLSCELDIICMYTTSFSQARWFDCTCVCLGARFLCPAVTVTAASDTSKTHMTSMSTMHADRHACSQRST